MDDDSKVGLAVLTIVIVGIVIFGFLAATTNLIFNRAAAPYAEETRTQTYEKSRSYTQGMAVDLDDLCRQRKLTTDEGAKAILADTIRLRSARFNGELPAHIQECLNEVR